MVRNSSGSFCIPFFFAVFILVVPSSLFAFSSGRSVITIDSSGNRCRITAYGSSILRMQFVRSGEEFFADDRYDMVVPQVWPGDLIVSSDRKIIETAGSGDQRLSLTITDKGPQLSVPLASITIPFLSFRNTVEWCSDSVRASFVCDTSEHFTGLGHGYYGRASSIDLRGTAVQRNYGSEHGQQAPLLVPFYLSSKGYGVFLNSTFSNSFSFGKNGDYSITLTNGGQMDLFIIAGPSFREILDRYTQLTGRPRMVPRSAFGLALSDKGNDHTTNDPSDEQWWKRKVAAHRAAGFPIDHLVNDNRWRAGGGQRCVSYLDWDRGRFPEPAEFEQWIQQNHLMVTLDFNRCIASHSEGWKTEYNIAHPEGIDFADSAPDLTKPEVRHWWWDLFWKKSLDPSLHFPGDALWIDEFDEMGKAPLTMSLGNGRTWGEMRNEWFLLIGKALVEEGWDPSMSGRKRPFVWVRGMTAGGQRYATLWSGDIRPTYDDMRTQIRGMQLAGLSGFPMWGHDAGGFNDWESKRGPDDAMYRQWSMAVGSFSPFWKPHGMGKSRWPLDRPVEVQRDAHIYLDLRYALMPYLYSTARKSYDTGLPIARAMVIDHTKDREAWNHDLQYYWGDAFLVSPHCADSGRVDTWLPAGRWYDFWSDSIIKGNVIVQRNYATGILPLFVKAGSIVPMTPVRNSIAEQKNDSLTIHIYTGTDGHFSLYEDDGISEAYRFRDSVRWTELVYDDAAMKVSIAASSGTFTGALENRFMTIVYHGVPSKPSMSVNDVPLSKAKQFVQREQWDARRHLYTIQLNTIPVTTGIVIGRK